MIAYENDERGLMMDKNERVIAVASALEMVAYAIEEGEARDVPAVLRMLARELRDEGEEGS